MAALHGPLLRYLVGGAGVAVGVGAADFWYTKQLRLRTRADGHPDTYWAATCEEPAVVRGQVTMELKASVLVVGGGLAGLHTALRLAEKGVKDVVVVESGVVGWGASGMSKGLAVAGLQVDEEDVAKTAGEGVAAEIEELTHVALRRLKALIRKYSIRCRPVEAGSLALSAFHSPELDDEETWSGSQVAERVGTSSYKSGEYTEGTLGVDPLGLTRGLARACEAKGVRIYERTEAVGVERISQRKTLTDTNDAAAAAHGGYVTTLNTGKTVRSKHVVLCGAEHLSMSLNSTLALATVPVYTWMAATEPLGDRLPLKDRPGGVLSRAQAAPLICDDFVALNYWRNTPDGRLLFGALADTFPDSVEGAGARVREALAFVYPELKDVKFDYVWGGTLAFGRRAVPLIGRDTDGVWYSTGYGGHGIVPTCMGGTLIADAIVDGDTTYERLFQTHFPPTYCGFPYSRLGAHLVVAGLTFLDGLRLKGYPVPDVPRPW